MSDLSTSRIRRKVRSRLSRLGDQISSNFSVSFQDISEAERTLTRNFKRLVHRASTTDLDSPVDVDHQQLRRICSSSSSEESDTLLSAAPPPAAKSRLERVICDLEGADEVQHCGSDGNLLERLGQRLKERSGKVHRVNFQLLLCNVH